VVYLHLISRRVVRYFRCDEIALQRMSSALMPVTPGDVIMEPHALLATKFAVMIFEHIRRLFLFIKIVYYYGRRKGGKR
jgi:hypothetical protein